MEPDAVAARFPNIFFFLSSALPTELLSSALAIQKGSVGRQKSKGISQGNEHVEE
jgi:hypothetical protein